MSARGSMGRALARFADDQRGAMSVEFMIVMPLLLFALIGGVGFYTTFQSYTDTNRVSFVVNDIMSRKQEVTDAELAELMALSQKLLPDEVRERALRITSICFEGTDYKVMWSWSSNTVDTAPLPELTTADMPVPQLPALNDQESIILTELRGTYQPRFTAFGLLEQQWYSVLAVQPRAGEILPHVTRNINKVCPA